jgi:EAL domain-containing protein (putative c-di-GMP-specific phosphodiesterase class I)/ActR/RegA family two-component response regulator
MTCKYGKAYNRGRGLRIEEKLNTLPQQETSVLLVDDEPALRRALLRTFTNAGLVATGAGSAEEALAVLATGKTFDAIVTDLQLPGIQGIEFLRRVRERDLDVPIVILTGNPSFESAVAAVQYGGFRYLQKPVDLAEIVRTARDACAMHRLATLKRSALELCEAEGWLIGDRAGLEAHFDQALDALWIAFQPIVKWPDKVVFGYEALVRSAQPALNNPALLIDAAERLGRVPDLGRRIRRAVAESLQTAPPDTLIFANLHALDLTDDDLFDASAALSANAGRVVLEITERCSLHRIPDVRVRIGRLRKLGFRIAVDDLGAGYAGLSSFSQLEPDIAKLDMSLVRGIDTSPRKASLVRTMIAVCRQELDTLVVCEGVETIAERDALEELGADLLQGYLFGRPERSFRRNSIFAPSSQS